MVRRGLLLVAASQTYSKLRDFRGKGFWERAGALRGKVLAKHRKGRLGDALIAQSCLDAGIPLLTRDRDFRAFAEAAGLTFVVDAPSNTGSLDVR